MSRSHKKSPIVKDGGRKKWIKRQASKTIRRYRGIIQSGSSYKKLFESWEISNYRFYEPWNIESQEFWENKWEWAKCYYWK